MKDVTTKLPMPIENYEEIAEVFQLEGVDTYEQALAFFHGDPFSRQEFDLVMQLGAEMQRDLYGRNQRKLALLEEQGASLLAEAQERPLSPEEENYIMILEDNQASIKDWLAKNSRQDE